MSTQRQQASGVTPQNSSMKHLVYGRIRLDAETPRAAFPTGRFETGLICLSGACDVRAEGETHRVGRYDSLYIPRDAEVEITADGEVDLVECSAEVENRLTQVPHGRRVELAHGEHHARQERPRGAHPRRFHHVGARSLDFVAAARARLHPRRALRLLRHARARLRRARNPEEPEFVGIVRDGDAVLMPRGFHPNVSVPGHPINFVWLMAAHRETEDRQFGVVTVQPGFDRSGTGLEASRE